MTTCERCGKPIPNQEDEVQTRKWHGREYEDVVICRACEDETYADAKRTAFDEEYERERSRGWAD